MKDIYLLYLQELNLLKVALKGDMYIKEIEHPTGSRKNAHKIIGVGMLLTNNIGLYQDEDATTDADIK